MDLVECYLHAVRFWLPRARQDDILAELSEDLRSQIDDRETELGRRLDEDEVAAILKKRGQPTRTALSVFGATTLIFILLERYHWPVGRKALEDWDPRKLPRVPAAARTEQSPRSVAMGELTSGIVCTLGWVYVAWFRTGFDLGAVTLTLAPVWQNAFWLILLLVLSGVSTGCIGLLRPAWTRLHSSLRLMIDGASLTLLGFLFVLIVIIVLADVVQEVRRIIRVKTMRPWMANGLAAS